METSNEKKTPTIPSGYRIKFYYNNEVIGGVVRNISTVCLLMSGNDVISRGIAICSLRDQHRKFDGRDKALIRALDAFTNKTNGDSIDISPNRFKYVKRNKKTSIDYIDLLYPLLRTKEQYGKFKSEFKPTLTCKEVAILHK